jgi:hypothetical protein
VSLEGEPRRLSQVGDESERVLCLSVATDSTASVKGVLRIKRGACRGAALGFRV